MTDRTSCAERQLGAYPGAAPRCRNVYARQDDQFDALDASTLTAAQLDNLIAFYFRVDVPLQFDCLGIAFVIDAGSPAAYDLQHQSVPGTAHLPRHRAPILKRALRSVRMGPGDLRNMLACRDHHIASLGGFGDLFGPQTVSDRRGHLLFTRRSQ